MCCATGITDNKGNSYAVKKAMSTKFPVAPLLMELSEEMKAQHMVLNLEWRRRDENQEADDLSNMKLDGFDQRLRMRADASTVQFIVLKELLEASEQLYHQLVKQRSKRFSGHLGGPLSMRRKVLSEG